MKKSRRAIVAGALITVGLCGAGLPAFASDGSSTTIARPPKSSVKPVEPSRPSTSVGGTATTVKRAETPRSTTTISAADKAARQAKEVSAMLDAFVGKITASKLDAATKATLLAQANDLKAAVAAGNLPDKATLDALKKAASAAFEALEDQSSTSVSKKPKTEDSHDDDEDADDDSDDDDADGKEHSDNGKHIGQRAKAIAAENLQATIDKINASNLPDDVKAKVIASLTKAKDRVAHTEAMEDAKDEANQVKEEIAKEKAARFADMKQRLVAVTDRVQAAIDRAGATPGNEPVVAAATEKLAAARTALAAASTPTDLRGVWLQLMDIRRSLPHEDHPTTTTTTVAPTTTSTTAPEPTTTIAP